MNVSRLLKQTAVEDGAAVLMVTHDHRIIDSADRLVHMVDGRIMSDVVLHDALRICNSAEPRANRVQDRHVGATDDGVHRGRLSEHRYSAAYDFVPRR